MAFSAVASAPARFGDGQGALDSRNLFLKVFGGEVFAAFSEAVLTLDKHNIRTLNSGKSAQFPKTWKAISEYHLAGQEMIGNDIDTTEVTITVDGLLVAHVGIYDFDELMSHFEVSSQYSKELGLALAKTFDRNVFRTIIRAARTAADGPFPGGNVVTDAALTATGTIDGKAWIDAIRTANIALFNKDVPEDMPRYMAVNANVFDAIKYAKDANGRYLALQKELNVTGNGGIDKRVQSLEIEGVEIYRSRLLPNTNETSDTTVYTKYRANYATTTGVLWTPMSVGTVKLRDITMESFRDVRRQEDFMVASMASGSDPLRSECAVEFKTS
jgi:hypothetical protein